ncbi:MAG TPA: nuclear transport factor 2 family protein [Vicinamibacterales bacterium]|nr:nuclear transport factor 2 family protein [Vicinamibacterales bacterium]
MAHEEPTRKLQQAAERLAAAARTAPAEAARHLTTVQEQIEAIGRGDFDAVLRQAHPDVELQILAPPELPFIRSARGPAELRRAIEANFGALTNQQPEVTNVLVQDDLVVMFGTERGQVRRTGAPYHIEFVHRFAFEGTALRSIRIIAARVP